MTFATFFVRVICVLFRLNKLPQLCGQAGARACPFGSGAVRVSLWGSRCTSRNQPHPCRSSGRSAIAMSAVTVTGVTAGRRGCAPSIRDTIATPHDTRNHRPHAR